MTKPQISVIIPVYNSERYIEKTVSGLLRQTFSDFEIICVNDCSKDNSLSILRELEKRDSRVKCIDLKENVGAGQARNFGIDAASGDYITFVDADDEVENDLFEKAINATEGGTVSQVVWGAVEEHYNANDELVKTVPINPGESFCVTTQDIIAKAISLEEQTLFGYLWNSLYKADVIKGNNLRVCKTLFYEDYFFNLDFLKFTESLKTLDYVGYHYYKRVNSSITHSFTKEYFDLSYERIKTFYEYCKENDALTDKAVGVLQNRLTRYTLSALARNNNPLSEMNGKARREWIKKMCDMPLYEVLVKKKSSAGLIGKIMKVLISRKAVMSLSVLGRIIYTAKK